MKKLLVLLIIFTIFLSGCGSYNLNNFVLPDDSEFLALVQKLDTPEKICQYMTDNFSYEQHILNILNPYQLYIKQKGDCDDFAKFAQFIANYHNYKTYLVEICYSNYPYKHYILIYEENGLYNFSDNQIYIFVNYNNIPDIIRLDVQWHYDFYGYIWSSYTVYDYDMNIIIEQATK